MANTLHGDEVEALILFDISRDLTISTPLPPWSDSLDVQLLDPSL